jgi:hypothetical protein
MLLVVKSTKGMVFGAFLSTPFPNPIPADSRKGRYQGTGETFVFTLEPMARMCPWVGSEVLSPGVDPRYAAQAIARVETKRSRLGSHVEEDFSSSQSVLSGDLENVFRGLEDSIAGMEELKLTTEERSLLTATVVTQVLPPRKPTTGKRLPWTSEPVSADIRMRRASTTAKGNSE